MSARTGGLAAALAATTGAQALATLAVFVLPLLGAGIAWRAHRREAAAAVIPVNRVSRRSGPAR